ncbi:MAG: hypothetical protein Q7T92_04645 [Lutibacter sp.]|nr:hypothetical protein [Lutibacter sp.]
MRRKVLTYLCFVVLLLFSVSILAVKTVPPSPKPEDVPPPGLPIDGGVFFLFIVGASYGVYVTKKKLND